MPLTGWSMRALVNVREAALNRSGSASRMPGPPSSSTVMNLTRLEPMTAPRPPRPWLRSLPEGSRTEMLAAVTRNSPAVPMQSTPAFFPRRPSMASSTAKLFLPMSSRSSWMATPSLVIRRPYQASPLGRPSMIRALMPRRANIWAAVPPTLLSLMPPVSGLLAPQERRPELEAEVPERRPGAKTSLLLGPRGWQAGGTSLATMVEVRARPPRPAQAAGVSSVRVVRSVRLTLRILSMVCSLRTARRNPCKRTGCAMSSPRGGMPGAARGGAGKKDEISTFHVRATSSQVAPGRTTGRTIWDTSVRSSPEQPWDTARSTRPPSFRPGSSS